MCPGCDLEGMPTLPLRAILVGRLAYVPLVCPRVSAGRGRQAAGDPPPGGDSAAVEGRDAPLKICGDFRVPYGGGPLDSTESERPLRSWAGWAVDGRPQRVHPGHIGFTLPILNALKVTLPALACP